MTAETLKSYSCKDLAEMARKRGVQGWHSMRKDQLVKALVRTTTSRSKAAARLSRSAPARKATASKSASRRTTSTSSRTAGSTSSRTAGSTSSRTAGSTSSRTVGSRTTASRPAGGRVSAPRVVASRNVRPTTAKSQTPVAPKPQAHVAAKPQIAKPVVAPKPIITPKQAQATRKVQRMLSKQDSLRSLAAPATKHRKAHTKDRLVVMVRDPYWLHAYWELTHQSVERAKAALSQEWHQTRPVLRLLEVDGTGASAAETPLRDIEIHGGVNNWYIDVADPPKSFRVDIGYRTPSGRFYVLSRSNVVSTPKAGVMDALDEHWNGVAEDYDKVYAMSGGYAPDGASTDLQELFEERLRRPMGSPLVTGFGSGVEGLALRKKDFSFEVDAEMIVYGTTEPDAHVTLQGDPVKLRPDGSFTVRFSLPNCRQVIPAVASSANGVEQRTIVLAVERNTKVMEPLTRDSGE